MSAHTNPHTHTHTQTHVSATTIDVTDLSKEAESLLIWSRVQVCIFLVSLLWERERERTRERERERERVCLTIIK